jgi:hypothetical protein
MTTNPQLDPTTEAAITRALETPPTVTIPADFAARVAASLPTPSPLTRALTPLRRRPSATWIATTLATTALLIALCILAPHTHASLTNPAFDLELLLVAELATLTTWLSLTRTRL